MNVFLAIIVLLFVAGCYYLLMNSILRSRWIKRFARTDEDEKEQTQKVTASKPNNIKRWEYHVEKISGSICTGGEFAGVIEKRLNQLGAHGWEFVRFELQDGKMFSFGKYAIVVFKRPVT